MTDDKPIPNIALLRQVIQYIDDHPEQWEQGTYAADLPCRTTCCIAGHAALLSGEKLHWTRSRGSELPYFTAVDIEPTITVCGFESRTSIADRAQELLGLTNQEADDLFSPAADRTIITCIAMRIEDRHDRMMEANP